MHTYATRRYVLAVGLIGLLLGGALGAALMAAGPADAANGDVMLLAKRNRAPGNTRLITGQGMTIRSTTPGNPPLTLFSRDGTPPLSVNRTARVENLNADLLDGYHYWELHTQSGSCWVEDAAETTYFICDMDATDFMISDGIVHLTGSAEILPDTADHVSCYFEWKRGDGDWTEIHASRRALTAQPDYDICTTHAVEWIDGDYPFDYDYRFHIEGITGNTDVRKVTSYWIWIPWLGNQLMTDTTP